MYKRRSSPARKSIEEQGNSDTFNHGTIPLHNLEGCESPYYDFLHVPIHLIKQKLTAPQQKRKGPRGGVSEPFPAKLYEMLIGVEQSGDTNIVGWRSHGRSFHIECPRSFVREIMPKYFKQSKLTSFQRQLNLYGFQRVTCTQDRGSYYHPLFLRGRPDICGVMLRTRVKGGVGDIMPEPDATSIPRSTFYSIPCCPPISSVAEQMGGDHFTARVPSPIKSEPPPKSYYEVEHIRGKEEMPSRNEYMQPPVMAEHGFAPPPPRVSAPQQHYTYHFSQPEPPTYPPYCAPHHPYETAHAPVPYAYQSQPQIPLSPVSSSVAVASTPDDFAGRTFQCIDDEDDEKPMETFDNPF